MLFCNMSLYRTSNPQLMCTPVCGVTFGTCYGQSLRLASALTFLRPRLCQASLWKTARPLYVVRHVAESEEKHRCKDYRILLGAQDNCFRVVFLLSILGRRSSTHKLYLAHVKNAKAVSADNTHNRQSNPIVANCSQFLVTR